MDSIVKILESNDIPCSHDREMGLVYVYYEGECGRIFSIYAIEGKQLVNSSVYKLLQSG